MSTSVLRVVAVFALTLILPACQQETSPPTAGIVEANRTYLEAYGEPPAVQAGKAYARVGYLPVTGSPVKVRAIPLYIYKEQNQLPNILGRLVSDDLILPPGSSMYKPFPTDTLLEIVSHQDKVLTLSLDFEAEASMDLRPMLVALAETAFQYENVLQVKILVNGEPSPGMPDGGWVHDNKRIAEVEPPALVLVAAIWDDGETDPDEITVNFDRPITVRSFQLSHADGRKVAGEYFTSVFQMSVIVHPDEPELFREGVELEVAWEVTDALGRVGTGKQVMPIKRFVHEARLGEFQKK